MRTDTVTSEALNPIMRVWWSWSLFNQRGTAVTSILWEFLFALYSNCTDFPLWLKYLWLISRNQMYVMQISVTQVKFQKGLGLSNKAALVSWLTLQPQCLFSSTRFHTFHPFSFAYFDTISALFLIWKARNLKNKWTAGELTKHKGGGGRSVTDCPSLVVSLEECLCTHHRP